MKQACSGEIIDNEHQVVIYLGYRDGKFNQEVQMECLTCGKLCGLFPEDQEYISKRQCPRCGGIG